MTAFRGLTLDGTFYSAAWVARAFDPERADAFSEHGRQALAFCRQWLRGQREFAVPTSGSTGAPRTVTLTREQMTRSARLTAEALGLETGDRALACLSPAHIGGRMMLARALALGLELLVVAPRRNPLELVPPEARVDFAAFVPLQLQAILESGPPARARLDQMKAVLVGGAPVSQKLEQKLQAVRAPVYQTFGMTETVSHIALRRLNGPDASEGYRVLPGVKISQDARGCLTVTSELTRGETLVTNDRVEILPDGSFRWLGRADHVINTGGVKVQAEQVERALEAALLEVAPDFAERAFFVAGVPDETYGEQVTAFFEGAPFSPETEEALRQALRRTLGRFEVPKAFVFVPTFPRTASGKIDRPGLLRTNWNRGAGKRDKI